MGVRGPPEPVVQGGAAVSSALWPRIPLRLPSLVQGAAHVGHPASRRSVPPKCLPGHEFVCGGKKMCSRPPNAWAGLHAPPARGPGRLGPRRASSRGRTRAPERGGLAGDGGLEWLARATRVGEGELARAARAPEREEGSPEKGCWRGSRGRLGSRKGCGACNASGARKVGKKPGGTSLAPRPASGESDDVGVVAR